jgi:hypothetical protein
LYGHAFSRERSAAARSAASKASKGGIVLQRLWGITAAMAWSPDSIWDATNIACPAWCRSLLALACPTPTPVALGYPPKRLIQITKYPQGEDVLTATSSNFLFRRERVRLLKNC